MEENTSPLYKSSNSLGEKNVSFPAVVADASFFAAFVLGVFQSSALSDGNSEDKVKNKASIEQDYESAKEKIADILRHNGQFFVPVLFWQEMGNVLLNASKPKKNGDPARITVSDVNDILYDLKQLPIVTYTDYDLDVLMRIGNLARENELSFYDATYLELARRLDVRLFTFDTALASAWKK